MKRANVIVAILALSCVFSSCGNRSLFNPEHSREDVTIHGGKDSCLFACAVVYPGQYDWQHGSRSKGRLALFCEGKLILMAEPVKAGGDSSFISSHTLMDGHLYYWGQDTDSTVLKKDDRVLLKLPREERIRGLLDEKGGVLTLSESESGIFLRRNGHELFRKENTYIHGDFARKGFGRSGALYRDSSGQLCFAFLKKDGQATLYCDGFLTRLDDYYTVEDVKSINGNAAVLTRLLSKFGLYYDEQVQLLSLPRQLEDAYLLQPSGENILIYYKEYARRSAIIDLERDTALVASWKALPSISEGTSMLVESDEGTFIHSPCCIWQKGKQVVVALSPGTPSVKPYLRMADGSSKKYDFNGYFTGVEKVSILPDKGS